MSNSIADPELSKQIKIERVNFKRHDERPIYRRLTHMPSGTVIDGAANEVAASLVTRLLAQHKVDTASTS